MRLTVMANDDLAILDFLADLKDRRPIYILEESINRDKIKGRAIINKHITEGIMTVLLIHAPFEVNEDGNILMLFVHNDLAVIGGYFKRLMEAVDYNDKIKRTAVRQILNIIDYYLQHREEYEKPQISNAEK